MDTEKVLTENQFEQILSFSREQLSMVCKDEVELRFLEWKAPWREESLRHYQQTGWSFYILDEKDEALKGYLLGQMLLFFRGKTQSLWIEHISAKDAEIFQRLIEISYRWARDKHLQQVLFRQMEEVSATPFFKGNGGRIEGDLALLPTTKEM